MTIGSSAPCASANAWLRPWREPTQNSVAWLDGACKARNAATRTDGIAMSRFMIGPGDESVSACSVVNAREHFSVAVKPCTVDHLRRIQGFGHAAQIRVDGHRIVEELIDHR